MGVLLAPLLGCVRAVPVGDHALAVSLRDELLRAEQEPAPAAPSAPARNSFLFVGGFLNEAIPGYFADNVAVVQDELGAQAQTLFPKSSGTLEQDAQQVRDAALALFESSKKPVVIIAHSKAGASSVLAVARWPELMLEGRVAGVLCIQGSMKGSPVAAGLSDSLPIPSLGIVRGLRSLTPLDIDTALTPALVELDRRVTAEQRAWLSSRVAYVRSSELSGRVSLELIPSHSYLSTRGSGRSDGLVLEEDMKRDEFGVDLGALRGDHAAFTVSGPLSNTSKLERRAFTRALLRTVGLWPAQVTGKL